MLKLFSSILLCLCCIIPFNAVFSEETATLAATVNKNKVTTGEIFTYVAKANGEFMAPKLKLPEFKNFVIVSKAEQRSYTAKESGIHFEEKLILNLMCPKPGVFTIEGFSVEDKGKKLTANSLTIEATGRPIEEKSKPRPPYNGEGIDI